MKTYSSLRQSSIFLFSIAFLEDTRSYYPVRVALARCSDGFVLPYHFGCTSLIFIVSYILIVLPIDTFLLYSSILTVSRTLVNWPSDYIGKWWWHHAFWDKQIIPSFLSFHAGPLPSCSGCMIWNRQTREKNEYRKGLIPEPKAGATRNNNQRYKWMNRMRETRIESLRVEIIRTWLNLERSTNKRHTKNHPTTTKQRTSSAIRWAHQQPTNQAKMKDIGKKSENKMISETWTGKRKREKNLDETCIDLDPCSWIQSLPQNHLEGHQLEKRKIRITDESEKL